MADEAVVVSLAERLKRRREELGLSQAQAARELDVARTAYRLWEMEAARPAPDRWRMISQWLGISVASFLLADDLISQAEASAAGEAADAYRKSGQDWDRSAAGRTGDFFAQARELIQDGSQTGYLTEEQVRELLFVIGRVEKEQRAAATEAWENAEVRKQLAANSDAPKAARDAVAFAGGGISDTLIKKAQLLASELVTNSVMHGPSGNDNRIEVAVEVGRNLLRVEVTDTAQGTPQQQPAADEGGFGLTIVDNIADRWGTHRYRNENTTWFELDLPNPGARHQSAA